MVSGGIRVTGLAKLTRDLQALGLELEDIKDAFAKISSRGAELAASYAPRRSGALAGTIRGNRAKNKAIVAAGRGRVKHAGPINYGWPKRKIQPALFMQKADEQMRPIALSELETAINNKINQRGLG